MPNGLFGFPKAFTGTGANGLYGFPQGQLGAVQLGYVPPTNGLSLWLRKNDPGTGSTWNDSSGYSGAGTLRTGAIWLNGNSVVFDGGTTCSVDGFTGQIIPIGERSIVVIATSTDSTFTRRGLVGNRAVSGNGTFLGYYTSTSFQYDVISTSVTVRPTISMPAVNTRNMWVVTHNATTSTVTIYLNGVVVATQTACPVPTSAESAFNGRVGGEQQGDPSNWQGTIETVLTYNRALSAAEILDLYTNLF